MYTRTCNLLVRLPVRALALAATIRGRAALFACHELALRIFSTGLAAASACS